MNGNDTSAVDFDGDAYRRSSSHQKDWGLKLIDELLLKGHERVLDLGCGDGRLTASLAERVPAGSVLGIDASQGMLATALKLQRPGLDFLLLDINDMQFNAEFDVVFSNATLHWVKDHRRLLGATHRALVPGGVARFNFAAEGNCATFNGVVREVMSLPQFEALFGDFQWPWYMPSVDEYARVVEGSPFGESFTGVESADRVFPTKEALVGWIEQPSLIPFLRAVPAETHDSFRMAVVSRMLERTRQPSGGFLEYFRRLNFRACKPT